MPDLRPTATRIAALVAAGALALTGCAATTGRHAVAASGLDCARTGVSAAAASDTVRCYLASVAATDTRTACHMLSPDVRAQILRDADSDVDSAYRPSVHVPQCEQVASVMRTALQRLSPDQRALLHRALTSAQISAADVSGSAATVSVSVRAQGRTGSESVRLVTADGQWLIDSAAAFSVAG